MRRRSRRARVTTSRQNQKVLLLILAAALALGMILYLKWRTAQVVQHPPANPSSQLQDTFRAPPKSSA